MPENTTAPVTETAPATPTTVGITINGKKVAFNQVSNPRGKGAEKNAPLFVPTWSNGKNPALTEILLHITALGENPFAQVISHEILRPLYLEASKQARVTADGKMVLDAGKFAQAAQTLIREYTDTTSAKAKLENELSEIEARIAELNTAFLKEIMAGNPPKPNDPRCNEGQQLLLKRTEVQDKLKNSGRKKAAAPAPAAAPAAA